MQGVFHLYAEELSSHGWKACLPSSHSLPRCLNDRTAPQASPQKSTAMLLQLCFTEAMRWRQRGTVGGPLDVQAVSSYSCSSASESATEPSSGASLSDALSSSIPSSCSSIAQSAAETSMSAT